MQTTRPALIVGANGLLTSAVAAAIAEAGVPVILHSHRKDHRIDAAPNLADAARIQADLGDDEGRARLVSAVGASRPLGTLVIGASRFSRSPLHETSSRDIEAILRLELLAPIDLVRRLAPHLAADARVLLFTDTATVIGWPDYPVYLAAKGGLEAAVRSLARSLGPRVTVTGLAPGSLVGTPPAPDGPAEAVTALARQGTAHEVAQAAIGVLGLPQAVTQGQVIVVDGGRRLNHP